MKNLLVSILVSSSLVIASSAAMAEEASSVVVINPTTQGNSAIKAKSTEVYSDMDLEKADLKVGIGISGSAKNRHAQISMEYWPNVELGLQVNDSDAYNSNYISLGAFSAFYKKGVTEFDYRYVKPRVQYSTGILPNSRDVRGHKVTVDALFGAEGRYFDLFADLGIGPSINWIKNDDDQNTVAGLSGEFTVGVVF